MTEGTRNVDFASFIIKRLHYIKNSPASHVACGGLVTFLSNIKRVEPPEVTGYKALPRGNLIDWHNITQAEFIRDGSQYTIWKLHKQDWLKISEATRQNLALEDPIKDTEWRLQNDFTGEYPPLPQEAEGRRAGENFEGRPLYELETPPRHTGGGDGSSSGHPRYATYDEVQESYAYNRQNWEAYQQYASDNYNYQVAVRDYTNYRDSALFDYEQARYDIEARVHNIVIRDEPPRSDGRVYQQHLDPPTYAPEDCPPPFYHNPYPSHYPPDHYASDPRYQPSAPMTFPDPPTLPQYWMSQQQQQHQQPIPEPQPDPFEEIWSSFQR